MSDLIDDENTGEDTGEEDASLAIVIPPEHRTPEGLDTRFVDPTVIRVREMWRQRCDMVKSQNAITLRIKAILRRFYSGDERKEQKRKADALYERMMKGHEDEETALGFAACGPLIVAREPIMENRKAVEKSLANLAKALPIAHVVDDIKGFGYGSLAAIVGECGDLSVYDNPAKVWKRLGLGLVNGGRQRKVTDKKLALMHGYSPFRRSVVWNIGNAVFRAQSRAEEPGPYRKLYDERKEYEAAKEDVKTKVHAHRRALRYMTKRLIREMWKEWRLRSGLPH